MDFSRYFSFNEEGLTQRIIGALMVFFPVLMLVMFLLGSHYGYERRQTQHHHAATSQVGITDCQEVTFLTQAKCLLDAIDKENDKRHAQEELRTQQHISVWTFGLFGLGVAAMFLNAIGIILIYNTLRETRNMTILTSKIGKEQAETSKRAADAAWESVKSTQKVSEIETRAYLNLFEVEAIIDEEKENLAGIMRIRNEGATPAFAIRVKFDACTTDAQPTIRGEELQKWEEHEISGYLTSRNEPLTVGFHFRGVTLGPYPEFNYGLPPKPILGKKYIVIRGEIEFDTIYTMDDPELTNRVRFTRYATLEYVNKFRKQLILKHAPNYECAEYNTPKN